MRLISLPLLGLLLASAAHAQGTDRVEGDLQSVNLVSSQVTLDGIVYRIDITTRLLDFSGAVIPLNAFQPPDRVRIDYFPGIHPQLADSVRKLDPPPNAMVAPKLDLNVTPGDELMPVWRTYGDDGGDFFGGATTNSIAYGDVDGDGFDDLVVGAHFAALTGVGSSAGEVHVLFGSAARPVSTVDLNTNDLVAADDLARIHPRSWGHLFGCTLSVADFDGDGFDDIAMGSLAAAEHGPNTGAVDIVWGAANLRGRSVDLNTDPAVTHITGDRQQEQFGTALDSGDINGDGLQDLVVGAPGDYLFALRRQGYAAVIYGGHHLRGRTFDLGTDGQISELGETRIYGRVSLERAGSDVAVGDFNGDGYDDVLMGADAADGVFFDMGAAYVVYGNPFLPANLTLLQINPASLTRFSGSDGGARTGKHVAAGDLNGDGYDDVVLSSPGVTGVGDNFATGELVVMLGRTSLPGDFFDLFQAAGTLGEARVTGGEEHGRLGDSLDVGDWNGDGFDDLLLGAPGTVPLGTPETNSVEDGALFVIRGERLTPGTLIGDPRDTANLMVLADNGNDQLGIGTAIGADFDRDGLVDYVGGAAGGDNPGLGGNNNTGATFAIFGTQRSNVVTTHAFAHAGDAAPVEFGPLVRARLDYSSGDGAAPSTESMTLEVGLDPGTPAGTHGALPLRWFAQTDRTGWRAKLELRYTDAEVGARNEDRLLVFRSADGLPGTWQPAGSRQVRDPRSNRVVVHGLQAGGYFLIAEATCVTGGTGQLAARGEDDLELILDAGATYAGRVYLVSGSLSGTSPGFSLQGFHVPLNVDNYYLLTTNGPNAGPFVNTLGVLDGGGQARARIETGPDLDLSTVGVVMHHAFGVLQGQNLLFVSNAAPAEVSRGQGRGTGQPALPGVSVQVK